MNREQRNSAIQPIDKRIAIIEGTLLMLDNATPHVAVPVQAICGGKVIATTLSDAMGGYQFVDLKQERYQVRCHVLDGYVYYGEGGSTVTDESRAVFLQIKERVTRDNIDFRFAPFKKGTWRNYTTLDGLVHNTIYAIYGDPDGVIWFGTEGGVSRYDGRGFVNFTVRDGLVSNAVDAICGAGDGAIWFGTRGGGVSRYDGKVFTNFTEEDGLAYNDVRAIHCAPNGDLWFGTHNGVSRYDGESFVTFRPEDDLTHDRMHCNAIYCDPDGIVWFGTEEGVFRYDGERFTNFRYDGKEFTESTTEEEPEDTQNWILSVHRDHYGSLWIGKQGGGLFLYDGKKFVRPTDKHGLPQNTICVIQNGPDDTVWFGGLNAGISRYDGKTLVNFVEEDGLISRRVSSMYTDSSGGIWFGTHMD